MDIFDFLFGTPQPTVTQPTTGTVTPQLPSFLQNAWSGLINTGTQIANQPYQENPFPRVAPLNDTQNAAFGLNNASIGMWGPSMGAAQGLTGQAATQFPQASIGAYMNPYQQGVTDIAKQESERQFGLAQQGRDAQATGAGAFGGSRQGLYDAEARRNQDVLLNQIQQQGANQAWQQGLTQFNADRSASLGAGNQFGQLGGLSQQLAKGDVSSLLGIGGQQQQQTQNSLDILNQNFNSQRDWGKTQAGFLQGLVQGFPQQGIGSTSTQTQLLQQPSTGAQLGGLGLGLLGLNQSLSSSGGLGGLFKAKGGLVSFSKGGPVRFSKGGLARYAYGGEASYDQDPGDPSYYPESQSNFNLLDRLGLRSWWNRIHPPSYEDPRGNTGNMSNAPSGLVAPGAREAASSTGYREGPSLPPPSHPSAAAPATSGGLAMQAGNYQPPMPNTSFPQSNPLSSALIDAKVGSQSPNNWANPLLIAAFRMMAAKPGETAVGALGAGGLEAAQFSQQAQDRALRERQINTGEKAQGETARHQAAIEQLEAAKTQLQREVELDPQSAKVQHLRAQITDLVAKAPLYPAEAAYYRAHAAYMAGGGSKGQDLRATEEYVRRANPDATDQEVADEVLAQSKQLDLKREGAYAKIDKEARDAVEKDITTKFLPPDQKEEIVQRIIRQKGGASRSVTPSDNPSLRVKVDYNGAPR